MKAEDVDPALVEEAARAMWSIPPQDPDSALAWPSWDVAVERADAGLWDLPQMVADTRNLVRHALAAVLPDARLAAKVEAITEARRVISQYLATAEKWRYDRVMWAFAITLGEIPEDAPCPDSPADARERAARLTAATEVRCNCGFGGFHDDGNLRCDQNATTTEPSPSKDGDS